MMKTCSSKNLHLVAQPQAGIGKRYIADLLKQFLSEKGDIQYYHIQEKNISFWDDIFSTLFDHTKLNFIIAVSSKAFVDFIRYLNEIRFFESVLFSKISLFNHFIFTPGRNGKELRETLFFIINTLRKVPGNKVVWENDNLGTTINNCTNGQYSRLKDFPEFGELAGNIHSLVYLPAESYYFQKDLFSHVRTGQTFKQAIYNSENNLIYRQRLYQIKNRTFRAIKNGINPT